MDGTPARMRKIMRGFLMKSKHGSAHWFWSDRVHSETGTTKRVKLPVEMSSWMRIGSVPKVIIWNSGRTEWDILLEDLFQLVKTKLCWHKSPKRKPGLKKAKKNTECKDGLVTVSRRFVHRVKARAISHNQHTVNQNQEYSTTNKLTRLFLLSTTNTGLHKTTAKKNRNSETNTPEICLAIVSCTGYCRK